MSTSLIESLQAVLSPGYALERELPAGGMSRVFVATETALGRRVVLKVVAPELAQSLSSERFRREIQMAAHLQHPHIIPLLTAGQAGDRLYYTMPFVEGESLRQRLDRDGELPVPDAVRLLCEIARALSHAHRHGIVHRDIKPGNILLAADQAQVTDFGLAKALSGAADSDVLTASGLAIGTPSYMAPEQAAGDSAVDHRADLYALGVLAYEMLTGAPPFTGRTPQALLAAHATETPVPVGIRRPSVPPALEALVMQLLQKHPADRPQSADQVLRVLEPVSPPGVAGTAVARRSKPASQVGRWLAISAATITLLVIGVAIIRNWGSRPPTAVDPRVVAVVPFRVTGTDSSLRYLREGMLDLLSTKLSGTEELRTVDPRTLLSGWRHAGGAADKDLDRGQALALARQLGAGRLLEGEATGTSNRIVLSAVLTPVVGGKELRSSVDGPPDSLPRLVDELTGELLALGAGEPGDRLSTLTSTSLPALRAYLDGRSDLRRGAYPEAVRRFERAMELDTSFALAGLGRTQGAIWLGESYVNQGSLLAWRHRDRLVSRDRAFLAFVLTPNWPDWISGKESLVVAEELAAAQPDNAEALASFADYMYHYGRSVGIPDALRRSLRTYQRSLALDSTYTPSWEHLGEIYLKTGDTAAARRAIRLRLQLDSVSNLAARDRWFARRILRDSSIADQSLTDDSLVFHPGEILRLAIVFGDPFNDGDSLLKLAFASAQSERDRMRHQRWARWYYLVRGWPGKALSVTRPDGRLALVGELICDALYGNGDSALAARLSSQVPKFFYRPGPSEDASVVLAQYAAAQLQLASGTSRLARRAVRAWLTTAIKPDSSYPFITGELASRLFARLLDTELAARDRRPDARVRLEQLDSLLEAAPTTGDFFELAGNVEAARLWQESGDPARALNAIRRRVEGFEGTYLPLYLRDEGRYAALTGDRSGAIKAYRHYLMLRSDAEPSLQPQVSAVRAELASLEKDTPDR
jgi:eukaryotic-like serine/threonine-protein kinase